MTSGVYEIRNTRTGQVYIGQSANIEDRWQVHHFLLTTAKHPNERLQAAWVQHGSQAFRFSVLEPCADEETRLRRERAYIEHAGPRVYNTVHAPLPGAVSVAFQTDDTPGGFMAILKAMDAVIWADQQLDEQGMTCPCCGEPLRLGIEHEGP